jgi:membrane protease YdiL (CAAX protease family)
MIRRITQDILKFLIQPKVLEREPIGFFVIPIILGISGLVFLIISYPLLYLDYYLLKYHDIMLFSSDAQFKVPTASVPKLIFSILIFAPIFEEIMCRGWYIGPSSTKGIIRSSILVFLYCLFYYLRNSFSNNLLIYLHFLLLSVALFFLVRYKYQKNLDNSKFTLYAVLSSAIFAILHGLEAGSHYTSYLASLPHYFTGLIFLYVTVKYGIKYSILLHFLRNSIYIYADFERVRDYFIDLLK